MNDTKSPLFSLGIMGPAISLVVWLLNRFVAPGVIDEGTLTQVVDQGSLIVGTLLGIYGRWKATKEIKVGG